MDQKVKSIDGESDMPQNFLIPIAMGLSIAGFGAYRYLKKHIGNNNNNIFEEVNKMGPITPSVSTREPIKKALLVGINKYPKDLDADLEGCVNDVENMRSLLIKKFKYDPENIRVVINERATRQSILDRLYWLLNDSKSGDELIFHYSGHGSQVRDRNGDELNDQLDEILCPHDLDWGNPLSDDILAKLFKQLPSGVFLTMICDACHSGTMTRGLNSKKKVRSKNIIPPFDIRSRSLDREIVKNHIGKKDIGASQRHVLISGCRDDQTSMDTYINGKYQGAFTWALTKSIKENPERTWKEAHSKAVRYLNDYDQIPQISGDEDLVSRKVFGGIEEED